MILGIGIDLVELKRMKKDERFVKRILSDDEFNVYDNITHEETKLTFLGGRFAAKEALFKAISKGPGDTNYRDFSILNDSQGKPYVSTHFFKQGEIIHLSITHTTEYAIAYVMIEQR